MRQVVKEFVGICGEALDIKEPVYEFGSFQVTGQEGFADLRPLFPGLEYVGCDYRPGPGVDKVLDLHKIDLPSESVGTVLILETLEHVEFPWKAMEEIFRILRPGGIVVMSSVMDMPIHSYPHDYWRFTPEAFQSLLGDFADTFAGSAGNAWFPHTIVGIGVKEGHFDRAAFLPLYYRWEKRWRFRFGKTWKSYIRLLLPLGVLDWRRKRQYLREIDSEANAATRGADAPS